MLIKLEVKELELIRKALDLLIYYYNDELFNENTREYEVLKDKIQEEIDYYDIEK